MPIFPKNLQMANDQKMLSFNFNFIWYKKLISFLVDVGSASSFFFLKRKNEACDTTVFPTSGDVFLGPPFLLVRTLTNRHSIEAWL